MEKIHEIDKTYMLRKITASAAAVKMFAEVEAMHKPFNAISDTAAIKERLQLFLSKWTNAELIEASILDGKQQFMSEVTAFYMRGLVDRKEVSKPLFSFYRP